MDMKKKLIAVTVAMTAMLGASCSSELNNSAAPVALIVTNTQNVSQVDLIGGTGCDASLGTIQLQVIAKNDTVSGPFTQVRATRYRVSYQRTDGGRLVPASFVRSMDTLLEVGGSPTSVTTFLILQPDAFTQSPFVALFPNNGGRDPDTGRPVVQLDVIVEVFGETLAGDNVYGATRFPIDFCFDCGGCV
jgi:hypothetical protein